MRSEQSIDGLLREQPAGVAQVILQIGVVGTVRKGCKDAAGQDGLNSFSVFLADTRSDFQRAKSREFSVTSVAPVRIASDAISRSRKWLTKSICPKVLRERRSRMPVSIHAEPGGEEKWPKARWA